LFCPYPAAETATTAAIASMQIACTKKGPVAKFANGRGVGWIRPDFTGATRGQPSPETNPIRPPFHLRINFATGPLCAGASPRSQPAATIHSYHPRYLERPLKAHGFSVQRPVTRAKERDELVVAVGPKRQWVALNKRRVGSTGPLSSGTRPATASRPGRSRPGRGAG
jgi:hypothetical protein